MWSVTIVYNLLYGVYYRVIEVLIYLTWYSFYVVRMFYATVHMELVKSFDNSLLPKDLQKYR